MEIKEKIKKLHVESRKNKDNVAKETYESVLSLIQSNEIALRKELEDFKIIAIIQKVIKQFQETADFAKNGGRDNANELESVRILQELLPRQLTDEEVRVLIRDYVAVNEIPFTKASTGIVVKDIVSQNEGMTDGKTVSRIFNEVL